MKDALMQGTKSKSIISYFSDIPFSAEHYVSRNMRFPTMWYLRPAKAQTSLRIRAV